MPPPAMPLQGKQRGSPKALTFLGGLAQNVGQTFLEGRQSNREAAQKIKQVSYEGRLAAWRERQAASRRRRKPKKKEEDKKVLGLF